MTRLAAYTATPSTAGPPPLSSAPANVPAQPKKKSGCMIALIVCAVLLAVSIPIVGLLAAIAVPNFIKARQSSQRAACVANLRMIDGAKMTWALENKKTARDVPADSELFGPTLYVKEKPTCPAGGTYTLNTVESKPTCTVAEHSIE
jgi:competence protein ComGC